MDHYDLAIRSSPGKGTIRAFATITATAGQDLSSLNLDLHGLTVGGTSVNGVTAARRRSGGELTVVPAAPIRSGGTFVVQVSYGGRPKPVGGVGWFAEPGGSTAYSEPTGAPSWFPCNDHPSDKATYDFHLTVPRGYRAIANGVSAGVTRRRGSMTYDWSAPEPMATYLATVSIGRFRIRPEAVNGLSAWTAIWPGLGRSARRALRRLPATISFFSERFGPYPFSSTGSVVVPGRSETALETQTRPTYLGPPLPVVMAHETAHQWFGDSVSIRRWSDVWLNEGFATWAQWLWQARGDDARLRRRFNHEYMARRPFGVRHFWRLPPGAPGRRKLFSAAVYYRGGLTLEALREQIGDGAFYSILRRWTSEHRFGTASTDDFIALAEAESGRSLSAFFRAWLYEPVKPPAQ